MKRVLFLLGILVLLAGCGSQSIPVADEQPYEPSEEDIAKVIISKVIVDPDANLAGCDDIIDDDAKQTCYGTYLSVKADREEGIDASVCDKITDAELKDGCFLYAALKESGR